MSMSARIHSYDPMIIFGIEVFHGTVEDPVEKWRLHATHYAKQQALDDLRWQTPNRVVEIAVTAERTDTEPILRSSYEEALTIARREFDLAKQSGAQS